MKITCPANKEHKRFFTVVCISQLWIVDGSGLFQETVEECSDVIHGPQSGDIFTCEECGAEVKAG